MNDAFRNFMAGLIDYAGLFPPAGLPMETAVRNYLEYRGGSDRYMLGRFICPAARLTELAEEMVGIEEPLPLSVLGSPAETRSDYVANLDRDAAAVRTFLDRRPGAGRAQSREVRLAPQTLAAADPAEVTDCVHGTADSWRAAGLAACPTFFEAGLKGDWRKNLAAVIEGIRAVNLKKGEDAAGLKIRFGGLEKAAFPGLEKIAFVLAACRDAGIPFKATAGLHHPIRHFRKIFDTHMHGFVNVFGAGVLATTHGLAEADLVRILGEENPAGFQFSEQGFSWRGKVASADEVALAREHFGVSFGSCSFDEPREDLMGLGWL